MKPFVASILALMTASLFCTTAQAAGESRSYVVVRGSYPGASTFDYRALYLSYALHYEPSDRLALHLAVRKGSGENGYYPAGYFGEAEAGLYERGSYSLALSGSGGRNRVIVGNYTPLFGQGLLFGGTYALSLKKPYYEAARHRDVVNPATSASKAGVLEGVVLEYRMKGVTLRPFVSWNSFDCSAGESGYYLYNDNDADGSPNDVDEDDFSGRGGNFPSGYSCKTELFRSLREEPEYDEGSGRDKRNNLTEYLAGVNLSAGGEALKAGGTLLYSRFNRLVDPYYSYDPDKGSKTGYYFRGKDYAAASLYFKSYGFGSDESLELFGEAAGTLHRRISYYPEFNGGLSSAVGLSGGLRKRFSRSGFIVWGAYVPATLVNPHGQEFPDGANNLAYGLVGYHRARARRKVDARILVHRELYDKNDPKEPETELSALYDLERPWGKGVTIGVEQELAFVDNYYSETGRISWKMSTEVSAKVGLGRSDSLTFALESRAGGPVDGTANGGAGVSAELVVRKDKSGAAVRLMGYATADDEFGVLYPYERPLYSWSVFAPSLRGRGVYGYALLMRDLGKTSALGAKIRWVIDARDPERREAGVSVHGEYGF